MVKSEEKNEIMRMLGKTSTMSEINIENQEQQEQQEPQVQYTDEVP